MREVVIFLRIKHPQMYVQNLEHMRFVRLLRCDVPLGSEVIGVSAQGLLRVGRATVDTTLYKPFSSSLELNPSTFGGLERLKTGIARTVRA